VTSLQKNARWQNGLPPPIFHLDTKLPWFYHVQLVISIVVAGGMADFETFFKLIWYLFLFTLIVWVTVFGLTFAGFFLIFLIKSRRLRYWFPQYFENANPISLMLPSVMCAGILWIASVSTALIIQYSVYGHPAGFARINYSVLTEQGMKFGITLWIAWTASLAFEGMQSQAARIVAGVGGAAIIAVEFLPWPVIVRFESFRNDFGAMLNTVRNHAIESLVAPIAIFNKVMAGIGEDGSYPFKLIWELIKLHNGNQFELAYYYPSIMIVIMVA
jgi:hypothetical protein